MDTSTRLYNRRTYRATFWLANTYQATLKALQLAFSSARSEAALLRTTEQPAEAPDDDKGPEPGSRNIDQVVAKAAQRIAGVQSSIEEVESALAKASGKSRQKLEARRQELQAELNLAKQIQSTVQGIANYIGSLGGVA